MPITASLGALTYNKASSLVVPGSGFWKSTSFPTLASIISAFDSAICNPWDPTGYTLEFWAYYTKRTAPNGFTNNIGNFVRGFNYYWSVYVNNNGAVVVQWNTGSIQTANNLITLNTWINIAVTFSTTGGTTTINIYVNGTLSQTGTTTYNSFTNQWAVSTVNNTPAEQNCYYDELRISNIVRYTSNYTVAQSQFIPDNNTLLLLHFGYNVNDNPGIPTITDSSFYNIGITNSPLYPITISTTIYKF